jgi:hypothetical protein
MLQGRDSKRSTRCTWYQRSSASSNRSLVKDLLMIKRFFYSIASTIVLSVLLTNCYSVSHYSGDGRLIDRGPFAATDRYILDLGLISLNKQGISTYRLENLPPVNFVLGIEIQVSPECRTIINNHSIKPTVLIELSGPQGRSVIRDQSSLENWTWSLRVKDNNAFVYRREQPSTFFTPIANGRYKLKIGIVHPDSFALKYTARLIVKSGGNK